jgi:hypothetical protein
MNVQQESQLQSWPGAETVGKLRRQLQLCKRHVMAAQQSKQQLKNKPAMVMAKRHETMGETLIFLQQAK